MEYGYINGKDLCFFGCINLNFFFIFFFLLMTRTRVYIHERELLIYSTNEWEAVNENHDSLSTVRKLIIIKML